jgi:hypothetical protein
MSLSRALFRLRQQANNIKVPTARAPPPTDATVIPTICDFVNVGVTEAVSEAACAVLEGIVAEVLVGELVAVWILSVDGAVVFGLVIPAKLELVDAEFGMVVGLGAIRTMLGIELCTINVAVIVLCVFGRTLAWPLHIVYASTTTASVFPISI